MKDAQPAEIMVTPATAENLWYLAQMWECSVDEALDRAVRDKIERYQRGEHG